MTPDPNQDKMFYPNILVVGPSGSGKSSSLRNLNPETTAIVNIERKALPFKGAQKFKHHIMCETASDVVTQVNMQVGINPAIEAVVIESFQSFDESVLDTCRKTYKGYDIFTNHNKQVRDFINGLKWLGLPRKGIPPKFVIVLGLDEIVNLALPTGNNKATRRLKVDGKELTGTLEKEFTIVFFTEVIEQNLGGKQLMEYKFMTNSDGITSAKTPMGMFAEKYIDNDLGKVLVKVKEYYELNSGNSGNSGKA